MATSRSLRVEARRRNGAAAALEGVPRRLAVAGAGAWCLLGLAGLVLLTGWVLGRLMIVVVPLLIAVLIAALLRPVVDRLAARGVPAGLAAAGALAGLLAVVALCVVVVVPPTVERLGELSTSVEQGAREVAYSVGGTLGAGRAEVDDAIDRAVAGLDDRADRVLGQLLTGAAVVAEVLAALVLIVFLAFFLLKEGARMGEWVLGLVPESNRWRVREGGRRAWAVLGTYVRGVVLVATIDAVGIGAVLLLAGVPLALPLIVLTWLAAFFPIVGAVVAGAAAVLVALVSEGVGTALVVLAGVVAVQQLEGNVLYPVVVGPRLNLHPIVVLIALALGGALAGIAGAFLAVPVTTVLATVLQWTRESRAMTGS